MIDDFIPRFDAGRITLSGSLYEFYTYPSAVPGPGRRSRVHSDDLLLETTSMNAAISFTPLCNLCSKPVSLETARTDSQGRTVHEACYLILLKSVERPTLPRTPPESAEAIRKLTVGS
jgi:hypothetical protein